MVSRYVLNLFLVVLSLSLVTGCSSKNGKGLSGSDDSLYGDQTVDIYGNPLPNRPGMGSGPTYLTMDNEFDNVLFEYDSARIADSERPKVETVAEYLRKNGDVDVIIEGHCDERGSREYNMALGERRALATRAYLIGVGIDGSRIQTKSLGEEDPLDPGHNESSWRVNRRSEFLFFTP